MDYLYLDFVLRHYRFNRRNGVVEWSENPAAPGRNLFQKPADDFNEKLKELEYACGILGKKIDMKGDIAAKLYPFTFLPVIVQFWEADDEFPANLKFMFDENILQYMHYETIFFMMGHVVSRMKEIMDKL